MTGFTPHQIMGIIGYPVEHSLSPLLHTTAFNLLGIPAALSPWSVPPDELPVFVSAMRLLNLHGVCVTIPHQRTIIPFLDEVTEWVAMMGAANTIFWRDGRLCGDNTDVPGFIDPLSDDLPALDSRVLIIGAGGAARAVAGGCKTMGLGEITVTSRQQEPAETLAEHFGLKVVDWADRGRVAADIIVNTTPVGLRGRFENDTPYEAAWFRSQGGLAYDLVYVPTETRFLKEAAEAGWRTVSGLEMFFGQAARQFKIWTGRDFPRQAREVVFEALRV